MFSDYIQRGAISKAQFDKSLVVLTVKMGMSGLVDSSCYNDFIQGESLEWKIIRTNDKVRLIEYEQYQME